MASGNPSSVRAHIRSAHSSSDSSDPCTAVVICLCSVLGRSHFPKRFDRALNKGPYSLLSYFFSRSTNFTALSDRQLINHSSRVRLLHWCMLAISLNWNENDCQVPVAPVNVGSFGAGGLRGRRRSLYFRVEWRADLYGPRERAWASSDVSDSVSDGTSEDNDSSDDDESSCCSSATRTGVTDLAETDVLVSLELLYVGVSGFLISTEEGRIGVGGYLLFRGTGSQWCPLTKCRTSVYGVCWDVLCQLLDLPPFLLRGIVFG